MGKADPYVLALAYPLKREGYGVLVLSEETKDRPSKLSSNTACGLLRIHCLRIEPFILQQGSFPRPEAHPARLMARCEGFGPAAGVLGTGSAGRSIRPGWPTGAAIEMSIEPGAP